MKGSKRLVVLGAFLAFAQPCSADLSFVRRTLFDTPFASSIADMNNDGYPELPGLLNVPGAFVSASPARLGLGPVFAAAPATYSLRYPFPFVRLSRDTRSADLNNDGLPDLVNNVYGCNGDPFSTAQLYFQQSGGTFVRSASFDFIGPISGRGETIVAADFNNDGFLDLYVPQYTRSDASPDNFGQCAIFANPDGEGRSWLLLNKGAAEPGGFVAATGSPIDLTTADCGSDCANSGGHFDRYAQPEGAQAIDYDEDGNIDLFVGGMLFRNAGSAAFTRVWPARGITPTFDEGLKFLDWNNDGYPDMASVDPATGIVHLYSWVGGIRNDSGVIVGGSLIEVTDSAVVGDLLDNAAPGTYGMTTGDVNGDGYEDIIVNGSLQDLQPKIYLNQGPPTFGFRRAAISGPAWSRIAQRSGPSVGDLNGDGLADILMSGQFGDRSTFAFYNTTPHGVLNELLIEVLGSVGGRLIQNQQGRVVHIRPANADAGFTYTRYVDGGSGYMAQGPYPITLTSRYAGVHTASVRFAGRIVACQATPPAHLIITDEPGQECTVVPLPPPEPIPSGHEVRPLMTILQLILE
jgi:hypothetical protein